MKPSYMEMARAVERAARQSMEMAEAIAAGNAIGPSPRDIVCGALDPLKEAECLAAASIELMATARLLAGNDQSIARRKVG